MQLDSILFVLNRYGRSAIGCRASPGLHDRHGDLATRQEVGLLLIAGHDGRLGQGARLPLLFLRLQQAEQLLGVEVGQHRNELAARNANRIWARTTREVVRSHEVVRVVVLRGVAQGTQDILIHFGELDADHDLLVLRCRFDDQPVVLPSPPLLPDDRVGLPWCTGVDHELDRADHDYVGDVGVGDRYLGDRGTDGQRYRPSDRHVDRGDHVFLPTNLLRTGGCGGGEDNGRAHQTSAHPPRRTQRAHASTPR